MGHALMDRVALEWGDLPGNSYKCLMVMASCAMDQAEPPLYWGGWERLAVQGLGKRDMPADSDDSPAAVARRKALAEVVRLAIKDLRNAKAIEVARRGRPGVRAEFKLTLQRNLGSEPKEIPESTPRNPGDRQGNSGAHYQHSPHLQTGKITSPSGVPNQGTDSPVDKARSSSKALNRARQSIDEEAVA